MEFLMMMKKHNLFSLSLKDFFTPYFLSLAILPFIITLVILFSTLVYGMQILSDKLNSVHIEKTTTSYSTATTSHSQSSVQMSFEEQNSTSSLLDIDPAVLYSSIKNSQILASILQNDTFNWILEKIIYLVASYFILIFSVIIAVVVVGFFTPLVVRKLKSRHYPPFVIKGHGNILEVTLHALYAFLVMVALYIVLIPLYFIPLVNIVAFNLPAYYFFHKMLVFDVGSTINTKKEYKHIKSIVGNQIRVRTFLMYLLTMIPFVGVFFPLLFVIYLSHIFINETVELREVIDE